LSEDFCIGPQLLNRSNLANFPPDLPPKAYYLNCSVCPISRTFSYFSPLSSVPLISSRSLTLVPGRSHMSARAGPCGSRCGTWWMRGGAGRPSGRAASPSRTTPAPSGDQQPHLIIRNRPLGGGRARDREGCPYPTGSTWSRNRRG